jgi:hypothetical protein
VGLDDRTTAVQAAGLGFVVISIMLFVLLFVGAYGAGIGALGGFAGDRLADR